MSAARGRWLLRSVHVRDLLAYQGEQRFEFGPGLQVLEAPNHTGKSSLAMAVLWGLTGQIPRLGRLDRTSFSLANRHAGAAAECGVVLELATADGRAMQVRRRWERRKKAEDALELAIGDEELTGAAAAERLLDELGLSVASLEGCGVVLQDHRLKLIAGTSSELSEVVNDMLGLVSLSAVVPALREMSLAAEALRREIEAYARGGTPLERWEEEERRRADEVRAREDEALAAGYAAEALEDPPRLLAQELAELAGAMDAGAAAAGEPRPEIERLRQRLGALRRAAPETRRLAEVTARRPLLEAAAAAARALQERWREHDVTMTAEAARGELDAALLARAVAEADTRLIDVRVRTEGTLSEQELLGAAYQHLLRHPQLAECPVCLGPRPAAELLRRVRERMDAGTAVALERLKAEHDAQVADRQRAESRLAEVRELAAAHERLVRQSRHEAEELTRLGLRPEWALEEEALFRRGEAREELAKRIETAAEAAAARAAELHADEQALRQAMAEREEKLLQPLERRVNRARDLLVPLLDAVTALESHGALRELAESRTGELESLQQEARELATRLKRIANAVSEEESARAGAAIQARLPFVSEFFARVAGNPDFTGLDVVTDVKRDKVTYSLRATSRRSAALADMVGHVLSEGDLSAAGMALLLGLATGDSHRLGFLLLDDPAQGMDPTLQRNFARELARLADRPQIIILTHQPEFCDCLAACGAERRALGTWEGGRLVHA